MVQLSVEQAIEVIGSKLSEPSKMPCYGLSLPTYACKSGAKLAKVPGTICSKCYAMRGHYQYDVVQKALTRRLDAIKNPLWVSAVVALIKAYDTTGYFRWHDSGDLQSVHHFRKIVEVAEAMPDVKFWLPTREYSMVGDFKRAGGKIPSNLCVRFSAMHFEKPAPESAARNLGVQVSGASKTAYTCPASQQDNKCLRCRKCWDKKEFSITYKRH